MLETKLNNIDQTFWIFYFLCVFGFLTQKQEKIDQKQQCKNIFYFYFKYKQTEHTMQIAYKRVCALQKRDQIKVKR